MKTFNYLIATTICLSFVSCDLSEKISSLTGAVSLQEKYAAFEFTGAMVSIPAGSFTMGTDEPTQPYPLGTDNAMPAHEVELDAFEMAATEVTNKQYAGYLNAALSEGLVKVEEWNSGNGWIMTRLKESFPAYRIVGAEGTPYAGLPYVVLSPTSSFSKSGISEHPLGQSMIIYNKDENYFHVRLGFDDYPVTFITWYGADAFAEFYDISLPTEAQWEYAAKGGKNFMYPSDDGTLDCKKINYGCDLYNHALPWPLGSEEGTPFPEEYVIYPTPAITTGNPYPPNPYGLYNMGGNLLEWTKDWYSEDFYKESFDKGKVKNPVNLEGEDAPVEKQFTESKEAFKYDISTRVGRSTGYGFYGATTKTTFRWSVPPARGNDHFGFRVVNNK